ncbi:MAG: RagB/SusD family nutrient uptake outer membrane protein [Chryseobacterium sp.]|uniref:RagB/SusD family nutrient uptake outer membrane protein n=1 Tax=Chryseobacterium sp. TaxID=1871047 RepID=UPI0025C2C59F|nr:RagB/SusD family nutrient uptake outer membrane protein [Chryseobacterium sp.]MCJ7935968.1 RagB/SusD family nutrient uptake outer membrane protein [Chryseobacterium sp.]
MKTFKLLYIIIGLLLLTAILSCEKLVEVEIPNNQITTAQVFENVQTANAALAGVYAAIWDDSPIAGSSRGTGALLGTYTDDLQCYSPSIVNGAFDIYLNQQIDTNTSVYAIWSSAYQRIYMVNAIIEGTENSTALSSEDKDRIKGEALLLRSIMYFYLQEIFGSIPYPVTTNYQFNQTLPKTSSSEVLDHIENDLKDAEILLKDEYRNTERIFPNRKVAQLILAKIYLVQHRWGDAETLLKTVVQYPLYQFENDITKVFNKSGSHIMWQLKPTNTGDATKEAILYYFTASAPANYSLSQDLMAVFSNGDLRKQNWTTAVTFGGNTWYRAFKYKNRTNNNTEYSIVFRLEEAYLLLAEALGQQNKVAEALPYINATRQRAGLSLFTNSISQQTFLNEILLENRKEFFTEMGHRFLDLKRFGRLNILTPVKPIWKDYHQLWPLPQRSFCLTQILIPKIQVIKMKKYIFLFLCFFGFLCDAKSSGDTLQAWASKFYRFSILKYSDNGRWIAASKVYSANNDTVMVFDTQKPQFPVGYVLKKPDLSFIAGNYLLASGNGSAELQNLKNKQKNVYQEVKQADVLTAVNRYCILDQKGNLKIFGIDGKILHKIEDVQKYVTDGEKQLFVHRQKGNSSEIITLFDTSAMWYKTENTIKKMELSPSRKQLIIIEIDKVTAAQRIIFIDTGNGNLQLPQMAPLEAGEYIRVKEIQNGNSYLIDSQLQIRPPAPEKTLVDIWYGNDRSLIEKDSGPTRKRYWLWNPKSGVTKTIPNTEFSTVSSIDSDRYFLAFNPDELQDYIYNSSLPKLSMNLFDISTNTYHKLDVMEPRIYCSKNGTYITYPDTFGRWILVNTASLQKELIGGRSLKKPIFSTDNNAIYFENTDDLWRYDIGSKALGPMKIVAGQEVKVLNKNEKNLMDGQSFYQSSIERDDPILISAINIKDNTSSYLKWQKGHSKKIVGPIPYNISWASNTPFFDKFCYIQDNLNTPSQLVFKDLRKKGTHIIYQSNTHDAGAFTLKQEIIQYSNSEGVPLRGILYYPAHLDPAKKYPMVVHIYQIQSKKHNQYLMPTHSWPVGFDIRTLLEKGYFVYLPDIVFSSSGTGLSALDCVNKALDAVSSRQNINMKKVGLIGHSHGGYETNFIAAHSNHFATYISGAGNSDIVRSYFSYNYNFHGPFYWQYENGQYEMRVPFSENKELYFKNSPIYNVEKVNAPILLWAGRKDENIAWDQVLEFYIGLKRNNKQVIALFYPNRGHDPGKYTAEGEDLSKRVSEWFDYFLKEKKGIPWINKQIKEGAE